MEGERRPCHGRWRDLVVFAGQTRSVERSWLERGEGRNRENERRLGHRLSCDPVAFVGWAPSAKRSWFGTEGRGRGDGSSES